jgi:hypothetical protein
MSLFYRIGYYLVGFSVGLIFLAFVFNGKKTSCNYSPSSRVKSSLLQKKIHLSDKFKTQYPKINDSILRALIKRGNINFSKSETQLDSCRVYYIDFVNDKNSFLKVANCEKKVAVLKVQIP